MDVTITATPVTQNRTLLVRVRVLLASAGSRDLLSVVARFIAPYSLVGSVCGPQQAALGAGEGRQPWTRQRDSAPGSAGAEKHAG
jgi:hypothetical protein